ncbi:hypothetical protein [Demequina sp.]|uniref:hypothetical protein n=1 Tax=Demequina sp. TaxID=2050685 RepID=UPI003D125E81
MREWAWIGLRDNLGLRLESLVSDLEVIAQAPSPRIRRFAVEITRPVGVWCRHMPFDPRLSRFSRLPEILYTDGARYVQDSVGNWMNDMSRTHPDWVRSTCERWDEVAVSFPSVERITRLSRRRLDRRVAPATQTRRDE